MSNLSDLLPSGGGSKSAEFVASGTLPNGKPVVLKADGTVEVVAEIAASLGSAASTFTGGLGLSVSMLTDTTFVGCGNDAGNSGIAACVIGTVSGGNITFGTQVSAGTSASPETIQVQAISATQFVVIYKDTSNGNKGTVVGATVSGNSITFGTAVIFESGQTSLNPENVCTPLSDTQFVIVFEDASNSSKAKAIVGTINSSNVVSIGATNVFATPNSSKYSVVSALSSTKIAIAWSDTPTGPAQGKVCIGTVSGTSISFGSAVVYDSPQIIRQSIAALSETKFVIAYQTNFTTTPKIGKAIIGTVSGTTITLGTPTTFTSTDLGNNFPSVVKISDIEFSIVYPGTSGYGNIILGSVAGTSITYDTPVVYTSSYINNFYSTYSATSGIVIGYDLTDFTSVAYSLRSTNLTSTNFVGMPDAAYSSGATATVVAKGGVSLNQTSLTIGTTYYVQEDGTLATSADTISVEAGRAISATSILLKGK